MAKRQNNRIITSIFSTMRTNPDDLGLGDKVGAQGERLINQDGSLNVVRRGLRAWSPYQSLLEMNWGKFFLLVVVYYITVNGLFGLAIVLTGIENVAYLEPTNFFDDWLHATFFSIQTFTSVGYGAMFPQGTPAHIISATVALVGNISFALATGLFFARFSKPKAQIVFSKNALITKHKHNGSSTVQFRIVNLRNNKIIDLKAKVTFTWLDKFENKRRYVPISLERDQVALFPLNWTLVHPIDENSPFYGKRKEDLIAQDAEILIQMEGYDETFAQNVHINSSYMASEFMLDKQFAPMYYSENGRTILELDKIHDVV